MIFAMESQKFQEFSFETVFGNIKCQNFQKNANCLKLNFYKNQPLGKIP